jgi:hypothetical protein
MRYELKLVVCNFFVSELEWMRSLSRNGSTFSGPNFFYVMYRNAIHTSKETHFNSSTQSNRLMLFRKKKLLLVITMRVTQVHSLRRTQIFSTLNQDVHSLCFKELMHVFINRLFSYIISTSSFEFEVRQLIWWIRKGLGQERPPLWSSGQGSWLQIRRPGFYSRHTKKSSLVSTTEELLDRKVAALV